ncbi:MAG: DUF4446 family protein [Microgenomates group bacterium]|nr:DUF4446 family protein [Microgenomates group bacterium]
MFLQIFLTIVFFWLLILSYFLYITRKHYLDLISRTKQRKIDEILDKFMEKNDRFSLDIEKIKQEIKRINEDNRYNFQKFAVVRYNPFSKAGGDQSFVIALLNKQNSGFIINFIYTHEGIRVYTKRVDEGKGKEYNLSEEEKQAIMLAK